MNDQPPAPDGPTSGVQDPLPPDAVRTVTSHLEVEVSEPAEIVLSVALATDPPEDGSQSESESGRGAARGSVQDEILASVDGVPIELEEVVAQHGARLHVARDVPVGRLVVDYRGTVTGPRCASEEGESEADRARNRIVYLRPSRYGESDTLAPTAMAEFQGLSGKDLLDAVSSWVGRRLLYLSGSSRPTDGAVRSYLARQGVCRDFAHLTVALLRACGVPARLASVYAPGLEPMDFHAVAEAMVDGTWYVVDATALAPRTSLLRIATGRDASDTAFLTVHSGRTTLNAIEVSAVIEPTLPTDDMTRLVRLR